MALKVADLFAELGFDGRALDQGIAESTSRAERELRTLVSSADRVGDDAGRGLADGLDRGLAGADIDGALRSELNGLDSVARTAGDGAGSALADGLDGGLGELDVDGRLRSGLGDLPAIGRQAGDETGGALGAGILDGVPDLSGGMGGILESALGDLPVAVGGPALAAGAAMGAALMSGFSDAVENEAATDVLTNRLSRFGAESGEISRVSAELFRDAWGDSTADVNAAIDSVYSTLGESREGEQALQDLTAMAMGLADVLGVDVAEAVSAAGVLISRGLADDAVEAFDLITAAAKSVPAAMRDEILTVFTEGEYAQAFETLGFDGAEAIGMLVAAAEDGTFALDKTGDSVAEFTRLNQDMSAATREAYDVIGLSAEETQAQILKGGPAARDAFLEVVAALQAVPDPADRARAAVGLFGTPLGDIASDSEQLNEVLGYMASDALPNVAGSAEENADAFGGLASNITLVKRELLGAFEDFANRQLDPIGDLLRDKDKSPGDYGAALARSVLEGFDSVPVAAELKSVVEEWWDFLNGDEIEQTVGLGPRAKAFVERDGKALVEAIEGTGSSAGEAAPQTQMFSRSLEDVGSNAELTADMLDLAGERADRFLDGIERSTSLDDMLSSTLDLADSVMDLKQSAEAMRGMGSLADIIAGDTVLYEDAGGALRDVVAAGEDAQRVIANVFQFEGAEAATAKADQLREKFVGLFDAAGLSDEQIIELLATMGLLPEQIETAIRVSGTDEAIAKIELLRSFLDDDEVIPPEIEIQMGIAADEGRWEDAANLLWIWMQDKQDGLIDNPLLVEILGDGKPADDEVDRVIRENDGRTITLKIETVWDDIASTWGLGKFADGKPFGQRDRGVADRPDGVPDWAQVPRGHDGLLVPGAPGTEVPIMALAGERVLGIGETEAYDRMMLGGMVPMSTPAMGGGAESMVAASMPDLAALEAKLDRVADAVERTATARGVTVNPVVHQTAGPRATLRELSLAAEAGVALAESHSRG